MAILFFILKEVYNSKKGFKSGEFVACRICGKQIYKTQSKLQRSHGIHYCSRECQDKGRHLNAYETRICEMCDKTFEASKKSTKRFCCIECQHNWQKTRIGELNPKYSRVKKNCDYCGAIISVEPYKLTTRSHFFCNTYCRQRWYSEVFSQSEDWKNISRKRAVDILTHGNISKVNSKPQQIVDSILDSMSIKYKREYGIRRYSIDNYLIDSNLMIEAMGDFWHVNPQKYDYIKYDQQKNIIERDIQKHQYTLDTYGIEILYLWEYDIIHRPDLCSILIKSYIEANGILKNYHSFNYLLRNGSLLLCPSPVKSYQQTYSKE